MGEYKVTAKVLNLGCGERIRVAYLMAKDEKDVEQQFIGTYMTLEIKEVVKNG